MLPQIIYEKQDLTHLSWSLIRSSSGTAGSFLKASSKFGGKKTYYKLSNYDTVNGITGHECVNEIIADRLLSFLGIEHLHYQLIHADIIVNDRPLETWLCASEDFKKPGEDKVSFDIFYELERRRDESPLQFCIRNGWADYVYQMLVVDFLILNRDRHGANIEILRDRENKTVRPAPIFDHGLSLIFSCMTEDAVRGFDVMHDLPVQCFVGSRSAMDNLNLIPPESLPKLPSLRESDRGMIMSGLGLALPELWLDKIWEIMYSRWVFYENFCNKG